MRTFFAPAIALMNRMRYAAKFGLMGVAVGLVVTVLLITVMGHLRSDIRMAENELQGAQVLRPLNRLAQFMQQHRGLSSGVLNGNEAMKDKRAAKEEEVSKVLAEVDTVLMPAVRASANWAEIRKSWESIRSAGLSWTPKENIQRHTAMIVRVLDLMVDTADASELTLDPVFDTYYMMDTVVSKLPSVLEPLGITRARGTGVLTRKELSPQMRIDIASTLAEMETTLRAQQANIDKVVRYAPAMEAALVPANKAFGESAAKTFALVREDILGEKFATPPAEYFAMTTALIDQGYKMMFDTLLPEFETQLKARVNAAKRTMYLELGLAVFVGALVLYLALGAYFSVVESVAGYQTGARRLAQGDLTVTFHSEGADELHVAAKDFNDMAGAIRQLIARIQSDVRELHMAAETLAASSEQISTSTHVQSDSASSMAASVEEMTVGVDHIAKNASEAQSSSRQSDEVAESGGRIVEDVVREIQGIADTVNHSAAAVEALGEQSNQISAIVGTIRDIADQTNLLALNAAIEAARAGESGRGFAVVADEVRKLAERTAKSTQEIADMIGAIQNGTATAVASMKHGVDRVAAGVAQAQMAGDAISRVQAQSREVRDAVDEISNALREQSAASTAIAQNVEQIAQMAEENNAAAGNNASTAMHLRQLADNLTREVSSFRV